MLKNIFIFLLLFSVGYGQSDRSQILFNSSGGPSCELLDLLAFVKIEHDGSWQSIVTETQKHLRRPNQELWEVAPRDDLPLDQAYRLFEQMGMIDSIIACKQHYRYAAILGSTVEIVRDRFLFLKEQWERGVRFSELIIMGAERPLAPFERSTQKTETEMMLKLFQELDLPLEWRSMPITVISPPIPEGKARPQTMHQFIDWMNIDPEPGSLLVISSQPFVGRQDAVARNHTPFPVETIGMGVSYDHFCKEPIAISVLIETLARWIYEVVVLKDSCFLKESQRMLKICGTITSASTKSMLPQRDFTPAIAPQKIRAAVNK